MLCVRQFSIEFGQKTERNNSSTIKSDLDVSSAVTINRSKQEFFGEGGEASRYRSSTPGYGYLQAGLNHDSNFEFRTVLYLISLLFLNPTHLRACTYM